MSTSKVPLRLYYSDVHSDNATMAGEAEGWATGAGYRLAAILGYIFKEQQPGTIPLKLYYSDQRNDNATMAGEAEKSAIAWGYRLAATLGYIFKEQQPGTIPLRLYYSEQLTDNATMAGETEGWATGAGYRLAATLGYIYPNTYAENGRRTSFDPKQHGFKFYNTFTNDFIPALDIRTGGLCGGMSYTALDYYFARQPIPKQEFRPANGTTLHSHLYNRQVNSIVSNLDKWTEIGVNPFGARDTEFFNWGISTKKGERIDELKQFLDNGTPCVIGLQGDGSTGNHQVIAIGYEMGRYKGDLGAYIEDFKIFVCDPNYPGETRTLIPDVGRRIYRFQEGGSETWRTYMVDKNYHAQKPPVIPNANYPRDNLVYELVLQFFTGGDDLRGGNDNIDLVVNLTDGTQQTYRNINLGSRWIVNNDESAEVVLQRAVRQEELRSLVISTIFGGGIGGDNWDMTKLIVWTLGGGPYRSIKEIGFKRFTGEDKILVVPINDIPTAQGQANRLRFTFQTGGDDLRGVNDNLNLTIRFRDGRMQRVENVNGGRRWADNTTNIVTVDLNRAVAPSDIVRIDLDTTFGGGVGGDNWNMNSVSVLAAGNGVNQVIATYGGKRFTGSDKSLSIPVVVPNTGQANRLQLTIRTGGDDLRGGNDNLNVSLRFRDGRTQSVSNVNGGARWANNTTNVVNINLDRALLPTDVVEVTLQTTFGGGMGGDNWNMDSVSVAAIGNNVNQVIFTHGVKRFTGSDKTLTMSRQ